MGSVIGEILPLAVGIAISPVPLIAVILMLLSPRAKVLLLVIGVSVIGKGIANF